MCVDMCSLCVCVRFGSFRLIKGIAKSHRNLGGFFQDREIG